MIIKFKRISPMFRCKEVKHSKKKTTNKDALIGAVVAVVERFRRRRDGNRTVAKEPEDTERIILQIIMHNLKKANPTTLNNVSRTISRTYKETCSRTISRTVLIIVGKTLLHNYQSKYENPLLLSIDKNKRHTQFDLAMDDDDNVQPDIFTDSGSGSYFREITWMTMMTFGNINTFILLQSTTKKCETHLISGDDDAFWITIESSLADNAEPELVAITYDLGRRRFR
uniref:Uncharacterized protein n=1 Tax=Wuchereria bancrofti TaxID=6293 RepID=A0AAF5PRZ6_WUCBA